MPVSTSPVPPVAMPGIAGRVDEDLLVRRRDQRAVALEHDVHVVRDGEVARDLEAARLHLVGRHADQPRHLARMRRDDDVAPFAARQPIGIVGERVQPVGVDHERHRRAIDEPPDELARAAAPARGPGPIAMTSRAISSTRSTRVRIEPVVGLRRAPRSCTPAPSPRRPPGSAAGVATVTSPAPDRSAPIAARCAAPVLPREPATTSTRP